MRDEDKTKDQLIDELAVAHDRLRQLAAIVGAGHDGTFDWDIASNRLEWDDGLHRLLGTTPDATVGDSGEFIRRVHQADVAGVTIALNAHFERGAPFRVEFRMRHESGDYIWIECVGHAQRGDDDNPVRLVGAVSRIQERKAAEETLRDNEGRYRALFSHLREAVFIISPAGEFIDSNPKACQMLGYEREELLGRSLLGLLAPGQVAEGVATLGRLAESGDSVREFTLLRKDGSTVHTEISGARLPEGNYLCSAHEGRQAVVRGPGFTWSGMMQSTVRLAGGLAHEFNNILTPVMGYAQLSARSMHADERVLAYLVEIQKAAERASAVTRQLLAFSRNQLIQPEATVVGDFVSGLETTLRKLLGEDIDLVIHGDPVLGVANVDPGHMEQVLVNLALNARDAMPHGGRLTVETANVTLGAGQASRLMEIEPGDYVMLEVTDTGRGMDEEVASHAFEPLFTTKEPGEGLGLGLSTSYGMVGQHGGHMELSSRPGQGTTVRIYLPRVCDTEESVAVNG